MRTVQARDEAFDAFVLADEPLKKPIPLHEQTVKDEKGRYQRFHGAFTGGFSAGYFNTVGTKEGQCCGIRPEIRIHPSGPGPDQ